MANATYSLKKSLFSEVDNSIQNSVLIFLVILVTVLEKSILPCTFFFLYKKQQQQSQEQTTLIKHHQTTTKQTIVQLTSENQTFHTQLDLVNQSVKQNHQQITQVNQSFIDVSNNFRKYQKVSNLTRGKVDRLQHQLKCLSFELNKYKQDSVKSQANQLKTTDSQTDAPKKLVTIAKSSVEKKVNAYISIDGNNLHKSVQSLGLTIDWQRLQLYLASIAGNVDNFYFKYYTGLARDCNYQQQKWYKNLVQLKYQVIGLPISQRANGQEKTVGDDVKLTLDLMLQPIKPGDRIIIVTGDGDFIPLVSQLLAQNAKVTIIGADDNLNHGWYQTFEQERNFKLITLDSVSDKIVPLTKFAAA